MNGTEICIDNIKYYARMKHISIGTLEEAVGVSRGYFSRYAKRSWKKISVELLCKVSDMLEVPVDKLFKEKDAAETLKDVLEHGELEGIGIDISSSMQTAKKFSCFVAYCGEKTTLQKYEKLSEAVNELERLAGIILAYNDQKGNE